VRWGHHLDRGRQAEVAACREELEVDVRSPRGGGRHQEEEVVVDASRREEERHDEEENDGKPPHRTIGGPLEKWW
jgi:hypothetical protein